MTEPQDVFKQPRRARRLHPGLDILNVTLLRGGKVLAKGGEAKRQRDQTSSSPLARSHDQQQQHVITARKQRACDKDCVLLEAPACPAWRGSECYAAMHSLLADMGSFTTGRVCIAGSFALTMYNRSRGIHLPWMSNDIDVFFLAGGAKQRQTLTMVAQAFFESWMEDSTLTTVKSGDCEYSMRSYVDATESDVAAWQLREKLSHMVSEESADDQTCAAARTAHGTLGRRRALPQRNVASAHVTCRSRNAS